VEWNTKAWHAVRFSSSKDDLLVSKADSTPGTPLSCYSFIRAFASMPQVRFRATLLLLPNDSLMCTQKE
jgi:hypothetical protein